MDNFELIRGLLNRENDRQFYFVQIIQRKKDIDGMKGNNRVIKDYYFYSLEQFNKKEEEIKKLCDMFQARAYIRLAKRDSEDVAKDMIVEIGEAFRNNVYQHLRKIYPTVVGRNKGVERIWIVDLDDLRIQGMKRYIEMECKPFNKIIAEVPTVNGVHYITKPFDLQKFRGMFPDIDVHKNNPTLLYANI